MISTYMLPQFLKHIDKNNVKSVFEVGSRDGLDAIQLADYYGCRIHAFECNPLSIEKFETTILNSGRDIVANKFGLGCSDQILPFFSYVVENNSGASSFFQRFDSARTQEMTGHVRIRRLDDYALENGISQIDLLCMDIQGFELNVLKGMGEFLNTLSYVIMEVPKKFDIKGFLPDGWHSSYDGCPTFEEIEDFMNNNGFVLAETIQENWIEDNTLWVNKKSKCNL